MANDIDKTSSHYKGEFSSIYEVNQKYPSGGVAGDYVEIEGWAHYWNADRGTWCVNAERDSYWDEQMTAFNANVKESFDKLHQAVEAATGMPENLIKTLERVDTTLADHQEQLDDKQKQIASSDNNIAALQTKTTQINEIVNSIAVSGGASVASSVTYGNSKSGLDSLNVQNAIDELWETTVAKSRINSSSVTLKTGETKLFGYYGFLQYSSGTLQRQELKEWITTDFISVSAGKTFDVYLPANNSNVAVVGCYDSYFRYLLDKSIIGTTSYSGTFTVPDGVSYIRFSGPSSKSYISSTSGDITLTSPNAIGLISLIANSNQTNVANILSNGVFWNSVFFANEKLGNWDASWQGGTVSFNDDDKCIDVTTGKVYAGLRSKTTYPVGTKAVIAFEAKGVSGDFSQIGVSFTKTTGAVILPLTSDWTFMAAAIENTGSSSIGITVIDYLSNNTASFKIRNCVLITSADNSPLLAPFSVIANTETNVANIETNVANIETNVANIETNVANIESMILNDVFDEDTDSLNTTYIENSLADFGLPSWVGKVEKRTTDLMPSINNAGQAYILEDGDSYELRIVKDALSIIGLPVSVKKENSITETKTFSMIHFGDSITLGVGASPNYIERLKTLLEADGHSVSKQTNKGVSGIAAEGIISNYKSMTADPHDIATLMIGMNDPTRWLSDKNKNYKTEGLKSREFRLWYRKNLTAAINLIIEKTSCSKLFLIVPYWAIRRISSAGAYLPSESVYFSQPLRNIVTQEVIAAQSISDIIHLCRADYYVPNDYAYIPDGVHVNNAGAQLLAQGLRNEMTFRV